MSIFYMSFLASILILMVIAFRRLSAHKLPRILFVMIWGVVLLRLLLPFYMPFSIADPSLTQPIDNPGLIVNATSDALNTVTTRLIAAIQAVVYMEAPPILFLVWIVGAVSLALVFLITYFRCCREYNASVPDESDFVKKWILKKGARKSVQVRQSDKINSPMAYGIIKPVILLPKSLDRSDETRLEFILAHEMTHIKRFDLPLKWLLAVALCLHWFNPLVWVMYVLANRDIEFSCDEAVVRAYGIGSRSAYASTLVGLLENRRFELPLFGTYTKKPIEKRIIAIMNTKRVSVPGIVLAIMLFACVSSVTAAISKDVSEQINYEYEGVQHENNENVSFVVYRDNVGVNPIGMQQQRCGCRCCYTNRTWDCCRRNVRRNCGN